VFIQRCVTEFMVNPAREGTPKRHVIGAHIQPIKSSELKPCRTPLSFTASSEAGSGGRQVKQVQTWEKSEWRKVNPRSSQKGCRKYEHLTSGKNHPPPSPVTTPDMKAHSEVESVPLPSIPPSLLPSALLNPLLPDCLQCCGIIYKDNLSENDHSIERAR
jgi:hypothetical protein